MRKICKRIILELLIIASIIIVVSFVFPYLFHLLWPFIIGWIISLIANPLVKFIENKLKIERKYGSVIIVIIVLGVMFSLIYAGIIGLTKLIEAIIAELPMMYNNIETALMSFAKVLNQKDLADANIDIKIIVDFVISKLKAIIDFVTNYSVGVASNFISNAPSIFMGIVFVVMSSFFLLKDKDKIDDWFYVKISKINNDKINILKESCTVTLKNYIKAQIKISLYIFLLLLISFLILRYDYFIFIAFGITILDFLPVFGAGAILLPWIIISFFIGNYFNAIGLLVVYLLTLILRQTIQPKIISDCMDLNPIVSLILMYVGYQLFSVLGLILSVPVGMIFHDLYAKGMFDTIIYDFKNLYLAAKNHFSDI